MFISFILIKEKSVSRLKLNFHWETQLIILAKSLFSLLADVFMSCVAKNKDFACRDLKSVTRS